MAAECSQRMAGHGVRWKRRKTHHVPLDVTVEGPEARVVGHEAQDRVRVRRNDKRISPAAGPSKTVVSTSELCTLLGRA